MFRHKIKQIAMASSGDYIFTFGLGRDGRVYTWNVSTGKWQLHVQEPAKETTDAGA